MEYIRLILGLIVPWMGGFFWLRAIEARGNPSAVPNIFKQIGYGLFLGYAGLYGVLVASTSLFQTIRFWPVAGTISFITIIGAMLAYTYNRSVAHTPNRNNTTGLSPAGRATLALLLAWIIIHLSLTAIEILYRPVFPWDAWLNWMYRAKAWSLEGASFGFSSPMEWAADTSALVYNVAGHNYPTFVPTIAFWAACSLGFWSDTLINVPVLFCGMALAMGIYGQCREFGGSYLHSVVAAYLLLSVPLVGTHLALAGYADIWIAGFTGLGFAALVRGLVDGSRFQSALGLLMAILAITVKVEGLVWFLATVATFLLITRPRALLGMAGLFSGMALIAWLVGMTYVELPGLGGAGYANGLVHIPFKGSYPLMWFNVWDDYFLNFFARGSWNLLWSLLLLSLPLLFLSKTKKLRRPLIAFYLVFAATQIAIFGFSEQGRWAADSTAINRLPMHFVPALILCLILPVVAIGRGNTAEDGRRSLDVPPSSGWVQTLLPPVLALLMVVCALVAYLFFTLPPDQGKPRLFNPKDMGIVVGGGNIQNGMGAISAYQNNIAIVSSGPVSVVADSLSILLVDTGGDNRNSIGFFWRRKGDSSNVDTLPITNRGVQRIDLSSAPAWKGRITEIGLVFYKDAERSTEFHQLSLLPQTTGSSLSTLWGQWTQQELWTQVSAHWIAGGSRNPMVPLPIIVLAWLLVALATHLLYWGGSSRYFPIALTYCLVAWIVLDVQWSTNRIFQASATIKSSPKDNKLSYLDVGQDREIAEFIQSSKALMPEEPTQVLIMAAEQEMRFQMFRTKYHLLPHAAYVHEGGISSIPRKPVNYVLMINSIFLGPGEKRPDALETTSLLQEYLGRKFMVVIDNEIGTLFQANPSDG